MASPSFKSSVQICSCTCFFFSFWWFAFPWLFENHPFAVRSSLVPLLLSSQFFCFADFFFAKCIFKLQSLVAGYWLSLPSPVQVTCLAVSFMVVEPGCSASVPNLLIAQRWACPATLFIICWQSQFCCWLCWGYEAELWLFSASPLACAAAWERSLTLLWSFVESRCWRGVLIESQRRWWLSVLALMYNSSL